MTQKQIFGAVAGSVVVAAAFVFIYRQFSENDDSAALTQPSTLSSQQKAVTADNKTEASDSVMVPVPDTIDGIASSIEAESSADLSALDAEENSSLDAVSQDSESVNNLSTSYDENNL